MKKKKTKIAPKIMTISGFLMMLMSFSIYKFAKVTYLTEIHSEVFGVGLGLLFIGGIWWLARIKLD